jgi:hypothetical protein
MGEIEKEIVENNKETEMFKDKFYGNKGRNVRRDNGNHEGFNENLLESTIK